MFETLKFGHQLYLLLFTDGLYGDFHGFHSVLEVADDVFRVVSQFTAPFVGLSFRPAYPFCCFLFLFTGSVFGRGYL